MHRTIVLVAALFLSLSPTLAVPPTTLVIVELESDPGAVYKAKLEQRGQTVGEGSSSRARR